MFKLHETTPLSRFLALILFVGLIPSLFFYLGMQYQDTKETTNLMHTYDFPRLYNFSGSNDAPVPLEASSTAEIVL